MKNFSAYMAEEETLGLLKPVTTQMSKGEMQWLS
jgi:hypothetical protein